MLKAFPFEATTVASCTFEFVKYLATIKGWYEQLNKELNRRTNTMVVYQNVWSVPKCFCM